LTEPTVDHIMMTQHGEFIYFRLVFPELGPIESFLWIHNVVCLGVVQAQLRLASRLHREKLIIS